MISIGICGAPGTGKTTLLQHIQGRVKSELGLTLYPIRGCATVVKDRLNCELDSKGTIATQFAIDAELMMQESQFDKLPGERRGKCFITSRTILDGFSHSKANNQELNVYYKSLIPRILSYDILIYIPIETFIPFKDSEDRDVEYRNRVDKEMRSIIRDFKIPVQIVKGDINIRTELSIETIKLRLN